MTPAERTAKIAELRAEADRLEREGKRNWPEKVEKGMLFAWGSIKYILSPTANLDEFVLVNLEDGNRHANPSKDPFYYGTVNYTYLGYARDRLAIKTPDAPDHNALSTNGGVCAKVSVTQLDAPEPTGAELVGKVCQLSLYPIETNSDGVRNTVVMYDAERDEYHGDGGQTRPWKYARLYRKDRT